MGVIQNQLIIVSTHEGGMIMGWFYGLHKNKADALNTGSIES
jgi:hypothetical protein